MIYEVRINPISGCQELVSLAGVESSTIGCVWKSTDAYACITDCADCSLGMINNAATQLGYTASASNSSTAIGLGAAACCTSTAIGNGACAISNNEVHIKGGCAEITNKCNCINISNEGSTVIDVSDTALNVCSEANIYLNVACGCIDIKGCSVVANADTDKVSIGASVTGAACSVAIGANATTAACSTAIGYCACATNGSVALGNGATATCGIDIKGAGAEVCIDCNSGTINIGNGNVVNYGNTAIGTLLGIPNGVTDAVIIGQANSIPSGCTLDGVTLIGDLGELGVDYQETVGSGDVVIGTYICNPFHYCASNGYIYSGSCLMTGRILNNATELPSSNCSLILYYVS